MITFVAVYERGKTDVIPGPSRRTEMEVSPYIHLDRFGGVRSILFSGMDHGEGFSVNEKS